MKPHVVAAGLAAGSRQAVTPLARASSGKTSERIAPWIRSILFPLTLYIAGFVVFFHGQIFSNFDLVFGDRGDARFVAFIHEHVYRWLQGSAALLSPPFFFNQTKTLGYSDAFLLDQIIYAPLRLFGAEPMLAVSLIAMVLSPIAFLFVYLFLRRLYISVPLASLAALIFTFANNLYLKSGHLQHFAVYYIPVILYCGLVAVSDVDRRPRRACLLAAFAAGVYGLLFSTGYHMAWFFGLGLLISTPIVFSIAWPDVKTWWSKHPRRALGLAVVAWLSFIAALSLFAAIYGPVLATGAERGFGDYLHYAPTPIDVVNVGSQNLVWSGLIRWLHLISDDRLNFGEVSVALTPVVQILVAGSAIFAFRPQYWPDADAGRLTRALVIAGATVCLLFYVLTVKTHNHSLFRVLYDVVPGAKAIRAGYRGMVVANMFAVTAIGLAFDRIFRMPLQHFRALLRPVHAGTVTALLALAAVEQVNLSQRASLSRNFEHQHLAAIVNHPRECQSFYTSPQTGRTAFEVQIDATMVAQNREIPTINGYSGISPPGWDFYDTNAADYEERAVRWAVNHGIVEGLCRLDVERGTWALAGHNRNLICGSDGCTPPFGPSGESSINLHARGQQREVPR